MKKKALVYLSGLILSTLIGIGIGRASKKMPRSSGTINVIHDDIANDVNLQLSLTKENLNEIQSLRLAVFNVKVIKVEEEKDEKPSI